jgi:CTP:molybdopterin cytidylyltransferase MocA
MGRVTAVVLAAGGSRRLGRPKQLVRAGGEPLVRRAARVACASSCERVIVVVGASALDVHATLEGLAVETVYNDEWQEGIASSIRCGATEALRYPPAPPYPHDPTEPSGAVVFLACDQPALTAAHLDELVAAWKAGAPAVGSRYGDTLGVPALFAASLLPALLELSGDRGAKAVLASCPGSVAVDWADGAFDVDTEADVQRMAAADAARA